MSIAGQTDEGCSTQVNRGASVDRSSREPPQNLAPTFLYYMNDKFALDGGWTIALYCFCCNKIALNTASHSAPEVFMWHPSASGRVSSLGLFLLASYVARNSRFTLTMPTNVVGERGSNSSHLASSMSSLIVTPLHNRC